MWCVKMDMKVACKQGLRHEIKEAMVTIEPDATHDSVFHSPVTLTRNLEAESIRSRAESTEGCVKLKTVSEIRQSSLIIYKPAALTQESRGREYQKQSREHRYSSTV